MNVLPLLLWHAAMVAACLFASAIWPGSKMRRVVVFAVVLVLTVGVAWIPFYFLPWVLIAFAVPLLGVMLALWRRQGACRWIGGIGATIIVTMTLFVFSAAHFSSASNPVDGTVHLLTYTKGKAAVSRNLNDPDSAQFRDLRLTTYHGKRFMCGEVNARNRMGGLVGFTRFFVEVNDVLPFPVFDDGHEPGTFETFMRTCYGDDWSKSG